MKKIKISKLGITLLVILFAFSLSNCSVYVKDSHPHNSSAKKVPPGQAKKANGDKSAKKYAPGQNK